jgi:hypothetical protein
MHIYACRLEPQPIVLPPVRREQFASQPTIVDYSTRPVSLSVGYTPGRERPQHFSNHTYCGDCGHTIEPDARYCGGCGVRLEVSHS